MRGGCLGLAMLAGAALGRRLALVAVPPRPVLGPAGAARTRALTIHAPWRACEPSVRGIAGLLEPRMPTGLRVRLATLLRRAGYPLGLQPVELAVACLATAGLGCGVGFAVMQILGWPVLSAALATAVFGSLPVLRVAGIAGLRTREVERNLPATLDLTALAMEAGLDFSSAVREVCQRATGRGALTRELSLLLEALGLGHTRRHALLTLAGNVPTPAVQRFVGAVIQAEERGSPLAAVLRIQAESLRRNRSILAEEAATKAALWLTLPMMLLLGCILLVLIGPFLVGGAQVAP